MIKHYWTEDELDFILNNYSLYGATVCCKKLGILPKQLHSKLNKDNLSPLIKPAPEGIQICSKCEIIKPYSEFFKATKGKNGLHAMCKQCFNKRDSERYKEDISFKLIRIFRNRFKFVSDKKFTKEKELILGGTLSDIKKHIEDQFQENMTWNNYGTWWEIDHIIPVSLLRDIKNHSKLYLVFNYRNMQPLLKKENSIKSNDLDAAETFLNEKIKRFGMDEIYENMKQFLYEEKTFGNFDGCV